MKGRLTVDKVNAAINDMVTYAEANAQLIVVPKKKVRVKFSLWLNKHIDNHHTTYMLTMGNFCEAGWEPMGKGSGKFTCNLSTSASLLLPFASFLHWCLQNLRCSDVGSRHTKDYYIIYSLILMHYILWKRHVESCGCSDCVPSRCYTENYFSCPFYLRS